MPDISKKPARSRIPVAYFIGCATNHIYPDVFVEMKNADRCCGSAGSFTVMHHELSIKVLDKKITGAQATKADFLATSCPTCAMQLSYGMKQAGSNAKVVHPVQLLAQTYKEP
ncbi:MAG: Lactate utilization protein A [Candidatus Dichloromethanomonas elyunquensis]|nr:MAG: Lactate utilization protein A [Candidatus Dichloromethanomonas elyunquensis]